MKTGGFKRVVVLGLAASALLLAGGCRNERGQGTQQGTQEQQQQQPREEAPGTGGAGQEPGEDTQGQPDHLKQLEDEEGFQSAPEKQEAPSGIGLDGRGGSGEEQQHEQEK